MASKYLGLEQLTLYNEKIEETYVKKEKKTGSRTQLKVLSDNNFTDELKEKLTNMRNSFDGDYESLTTKPAIDRHILSESTTTEELGIAKTTDLPKIATTEIAGLVKPDGESIEITPEGVISMKEIDLNDYVTKDQLPKKATAAEAGIVKPDDDTITVDEDGTIKAKQQDLSGYALKDNIPTAATNDKAGIVKPDNDTITVTDDGTITAKQPDLQNYVQQDAIADMLTQAAADVRYAKKEDAATKEDLKQYAKADKVEELESSLDQKITDKIGTVYRPKGSVQFALLPLPSADTLGDVYNVEDDFVSDAKFLTSGQNYPAGTNVVVAERRGEYKYDILAGFIDLSGYVQKSTLEADYMKRSEVEAYVQEQIQAIALEQIGSLS